MAIAAAAVIVPMGIIFFISGLFINLIQAACFLLIRPFSKNIYRRINRIFAELLWLELVWLVDWRAGVEIKLYMDPETFRLMGKEHALLIANHRSDIDWLVGWVLAQRSGCLGSALAVMKKSSKFLPVLGWSMWFSEYLFLERSWAKDENTIKSGLQRLRDYPQPFWLALFVEGTRFTQAKLLAAQEYAASAGLPVPKNVLIPRTKGFVAAVSHMRSFVPAIYDVTFAMPKSSPAPTMLRIFKGQSSVVHVHIKRHEMKDLPENDEATAQWCRDIFLAKDKLLDKHIAEDTFGEQQLQNVGRPVKSFVVRNMLAKLDKFFLHLFLSCENPEISRVGARFETWWILGSPIYLLHLNVYLTHTSHQRQMFEYRHQVDLQPVHSTQITKIVDMDHSFKDIMGSMMRT